MPAAVLWDMDGTLVDTEPTWAAMTEGVVRDLGGEMTEDDRTLLRGASTATTCEIIARSLPDLDPATAFDEIERRVLIALRDDLVVMDGALALLEEFASRRVPQAIVSASRAVVVERVLAVIGADYFSGMIADDSGVAPKPSPDPYLAAADALGAPIAQCLVFEDSAHGLAAARASGALVWDVVAEPLTGVSLDRIDELTRMRISS